MSVIGFDVGSQKSVIAIAQKGGIDIISNEVSNRTTPSMVSFFEKERFVGESAMTQAVKNFKNTIREIVCFMGRKYNEPYVAKKLKWCPFKVIELQNGNVGFEVQYGEGRETFTPEQIMAMLLGQLKTTVESHNFPIVTDVVISVPGYFTEAQRVAMLDASKIANLNCLRLLNDNTATALAYGIYKQDFHETDFRHVMFVDMGAHNFSCTIVGFRKGELKVISSCHDMEVGGNEIDELLIEHFAAEFKKKYGIDAMGSPRALIRLRTGVEKLKKTLSANTEAVMNIECFMEDIDVRGSMTRDELEALYAPLRERAMRQVQQTLADAKITPEQLHSCEIIGGSMRLPGMQAGLAAIMGKELSKTLNMTEVIAKGCALQCAILSPVFRVREFNVVDSNPYPITLSWGTSASAPLDSLDAFPLGDKVPSTKVLSFTEKQSIDLFANYKDASYLPAGTDQQLGHFKITVPEVTEPLKIKARVKLNIHGVFSVDSATYTEEKEVPLTETEIKAEKDKIRKQREEEKKKKKQATAAPEEKMEGEKPESEPTVEEPADTEMAEPAAEATKEKDEEIEVKATRTKKVKIPLAIEAMSVLGLPKKTIDQFVLREQEIADQNREIQETAEKKNNLESYIYDMRDKVSYALKTYVAADVATSFLKTLSELEDWLYEEGDDQPKGVYIKKLKELQTIGDPIVNRYNEDGARPAALNDFAQTVRDCLELCATQKEKYAHISAEDRKKVQDECVRVSTQIEQAAAAVQALPKHQDPTLTVKQIRTAATDLKVFTNTIMGKPKPTPKKEEPPKEAEKAAEPATTPPAESEQTSSEPIPTAADETAKPEKMDIDE